MKTYIALFALFSLISLTTAFSCAKPCYGNMCCSPSPNNKYFLTSFCDEQTACGIPCSKRTYFTANSQIFGCTKTLCLCRGTKCVKAEVIDAGPNISVEKQADGYVIDASPQTCKDLFGTSSCGWSDHFAITASVCNDERPLGLFTASKLDMFVMELQTSAFFSQQQPNESEIENK